MNVSGYAALFNVVDNGRDIIRPGAFKNSIARRMSPNKSTTRVRYFWSHDRSNPIGKITKIIEDQKGLYYEAALWDETEVCELAKRAIHEGDISTSIGFKTERYEVDDEQKARVILEADLREISLVTLPMCDGTDSWRSPTSNQIVEGKAFADLEARTVRVLMPTVTARAQAVLKERVSRIL